VVKPTTCDAVLFDRDGTLVVDVPYNADPERVEPVAGARAALDRLRSAGVPIGIVTNQSGLARRLFDESALHEMHERIEHLLGPFDVVVWCPHDERDGCDCRKPRPGLVMRAADTLHVEPSRCAVIGDTGADVGAAVAVGALPILVPNHRTLRSEIATAPIVSESVGAAVELLLSAP
jgi:D-glycero-D-manno-heptose 1,7-bisphosphate phosphatase